MALPAYDQCIKASHVFNLLDARGVISVTERQSYILRVRELAKACGEAWLRPKREGRRNRIAASRGRRARATVSACPTSSARISFSEEIPARMQARRRRSARSCVTDEAGRCARACVYEAPRRSRRRAGSRSAVQGVPARQPDVQGRAQGPARRRAGAGRSRASCKRAGLTSIDQAKVQQDPQEGRLLRRGDREARPRRDRGDRRDRAGGSCAASRGRSRCAGARRRRSRARSNWVRPLHSIVATFGPETEEPEVVPFDGRRHRGRRHDARPSLPGARRRSRCGGSTTTWPSSKRPRSCSIRRAAREIILTDAKNLAFAQGFELVEDEGLLAEVAGLVEWPVVLMGSFDEAFLTIPAEVIRATIRNNQKCFVVRDPKTGEARQQVHPGLEHRGERRRQGDRRRQRARHPRAAVGREVLLRDRPEDASSKTGCRSSSSIVFHEKLGTQAERIERIVRAGGRAGAAGRRRCRRRPSARRSWPRPICSPKWSANSPSCRA